MDISNDDSTTSFRDFMAEPHDFSDESTLDLLFDTAEYISREKPELSLYLGFAVRAALASLFSEYQLDLDKMVQEVTLPRRERKEYWHHEPRTVQS